MRKYLTLSMASAALAAGLSFAVPNEAKSAVLSNTLSNPVGVLGAPVNAPLVSTYDLTVPGTSPDGTVTSQVFTGIGPAAGLLVYAYQISPGASGPDISGLSWFWKGPAEPVFAVTSAYDGFGTSPAPFAAGTVAPFAVDLTAGVIDLSYLGGKVPAGGDGHTVYLFSKLSPSTVESNIRDGSNTNFDPHVYSPVPIPGAAWLFGSSVLGLLGVGYSRRRRAAA